MIALLLAALPQTPTDSLRVPMESTGELAISAVAYPETAEQYRKYEIRVDLSVTYTNPFHPAQVELLARFEGPKGRRAVVRGFFYQGYEHKLTDGKEVLSKVGGPAWLVRFTPDLAGDWKVRLIARDRLKSIESQEHKFKVARTEDSGFVRLAGNSPTYLATDRGEPFFGVGLNMAWAGVGGSFDYEKWFGKLAAAGGNLVRIWSFPGGMGLEWSDRQDDTWRRGTYYGLGLYSLDNAWVLDRVVEAAERHGIRIILCLGTYGELKEDKGVFNEQLWRVNPYNAALGGPLKKPEEMFTNLQARALYRRKLSYAVARWGYSPAVLSWELWNEVRAPDYWVHEMAKELRGLDPFDRVVTTSYGDERVWALEDVRLLAEHIYGDGVTADLAQRIRDTAEEDVQTYRKPTMVTELGIDFRKHDGEHDPNGTAVNLRTGLWQAAASGCAAGALNWWWDNYVAAKDLWSMYRPFAEAVKRVDWTAAPMSRAVLEQLPDGVVGSGVVSERAGFVWLRRDTYNWKEWKPDTPETAPFLLELTGVRDGTWTATWWDTHAGAEVATEKLSVRDKTIRVKAPAFGSDIALLLARE